MSVFNRFARQCYPIHEIKNHFWYHNNPEVTKNKLSLYWNSQIVWQIEDNFLLWVDNNNIVMEECAIGCIISRDKFLSQYFIWQL